MKRNNECELYNEKKKNSGLRRSDGGWSTSTKQIK